MTRTTLISPEDAAVLVDLVDDLTRSVSLLSSMVMKLAAKTGPQHIKTEDCAQLLEYLERANEHHNELVKLRRGLP